VRRWPGQLPFRPKWTTTGIGEYFLLQQLFWLTVFAAMLVAEQVAVSCATTSALEATAIKIFRSSGFCSDTGCPVADT